MIVLYNTNLIDNIHDEKRLALLVVDSFLSNIFENHQKYKRISILEQSNRIDRATAQKVVQNLSLNNNNIDNFIDFEGDLLFPSFIDFHCHSELYYINNPQSDLRRNDLFDTEVVGNCGVGLFPISYREEKKRELFSSFESILGHFERGANYNSTREFFKYFKSLGIKNNLLFYQSHSPLRIVSMENSNRPASAKEILKMQRYLAESLEEGCIGLSTGLYYAPCVFADERELTSLCEVVREYDGIFAVHRRFEGNGSYEATEELLKLAKKTGVRLQISHLKAIGRKNQVDVDRVLNLIQYYRDEGVDVMFDQYPFIYGSTSFESLLPPFVLRDGPAIYKKKLVEDDNYRSRAIAAMRAGKDYESIAELVPPNEIFILSSESHPQYNERSIEDISNELKKNPIETILDIIATESGSCLMKDITQTEESLLKIMSHPLSIFATDALYAGSTWHERSINSSRYILDNYSKKVGLEKLIKRATSIPAQRLKLEDRKEVIEGREVALVRYRLKEV